MEAGSRQERRKRMRTLVHWPVLLLRDRGAEAIDTVTQNLSSGGFYCLSPLALTPGESILCALRVPAHDPNGGNRALALECKVSVLRAEAASDGFFGIACRIEDYRLIATGGQA